jgi:hypothetical protein
LLAASIYLLPNDHPAKLAACARIQNLCYTGEIFVMESNASEMAAMILFHVSGCRTFSILIVTENKSMHQQQYESHLIDELGHSRPD